MRNKNGSFNSLFGVVMML